MLTVTSGNDVGSYVSVLHLLLLPFWPKYSVKLSVVKRFYYIQVMALWRWHRADIPTQQFGVGVSSLTSPTKPHAVTIQKMIISMLFHRHGIWTPLILTDMDQVLQPSDQQVNLQETLTL